MGSEGCLRVAIALDAEDALTSDHFGDAVSFEVLEVCADGAAQAVERRVNGSAAAGPHDHHHGHHGHRAKAQAIMRQISEAGVQVIVGRAFGANISRVATRFVPVIVRTETVPQTIAALQASWPRVIAAWEAGPERRHLVLR